jgi:hypothetical protein
VLLPLLLAAGGWFGFHSQRDVWFLAVLSVTATFLALRDKGVPNPLNRRQIVTALLLAAGIYTVQLHWGDLSSRDLQQAVKRSFPEDASQFLEAQGLPDPIFNPYEWGGYLMWRFPGRLVSIDGRAQLYGDEGLSRSFATQAGAAGWRNNPQLQSARTILAGRESALASLLQLDHAFHVVYRDPVAIVFLHDIN